MFPVLPGCPLHLRCQRHLTAASTLRDKASPPSQRCGRRRPVAATAQQQPAGDLRDAIEGARDPFDAEIASNFTDKTLGFSDTFHIVRGPEAMKKFVGLAAKRCIPCEGKDVQALDIVAADKLRSQTPGWRIVQGDSGQLSLRQDWKVSSFVAGLVLFERVAAIAEVEGHHPNLHLEGYNNAWAELSTHSVGGLTENDFILAAKINALSFVDLLPKKKPKFWA